MAAWIGRKGKKYTMKKKNSDKNEHNRKESALGKLFGVINAKR